MQRRGSPLIVVTAPPDAKMVAPRNPQDSMKSTWRGQDKNTWGFSHWILHVLNVHPTDFNRDVPVHAKTDPLPYLSERMTHAYIMLAATWPMILHQAYVWYFGKNFSALGALALYGAAFNLNGIHLMWTLRRLGHIYGFLDGDKHERDQVPDASVNKVVSALLMTSSVRPLMTLFLAWNNNQGPLDVSWWIVLEVGLYQVVLDFWFYWYHRFMHESDTLWQYHRTHHLTKHPNPLMTLFADHPQEFFDIVGIPMLTWITLKFFGLPMNFYDWWICHQYVVFLELSGHSGLRIYSAPPTPFRALYWYLGAEICIEDHDLHHRQGWKRSANYGKQSMLWDQVFGTRAKRIELQKDRVNFNDRVNLFF